MQTDIKTVEIEQGNRKTFWQCVSACFGVAWKILCFPFQVLWLAYCALWVLIDIGKYVLIRFVKWCLFPSFGGIVFWYFWPDKPVIAGGLTAMGFLCFLLSVVYDLWNEFKQDLP